MPGYHRAAYAPTEALLAELFLGPIDFGVQAVGRWMNGEKVFERMKKKKTKGKAVPARHWKYYYERLKRRGLVQDRTVGNRVMIRLTDEGFTSVWRTRIRAGKSAAQGSNVCVVIFDIPEKQRHARDAFRYFLKQCDFKQLQRSVWSCPQTMAREVIAFVKHLKLERWVRVIEGQVTL